MTTLVLCAALSLTCIRVPATLLLNRHRASLVMMMVWGAVSLRVAGARLAAFNLSCHAKYDFQLEYFLKYWLTWHVSWILICNWSERNSTPEYIKTAEAAVRTSGHCSSGVMRQEWFYLVNSIFMEDSFKHWTEVVFKFMQIFIVI